MGQIRHPDKVKLIVGLLSGEIEAFASVEKKLRRHFGEIDFASQLIDFTHTDYYRDEMGPGLKRRFLSFKRPFGLENIYTIKNRTNTLESRYSRFGKRTVNIDPGYLNLSKLVLFSTKDYSHRIFLNKGIFAEVTLFYKNNKFNPWPWTYPDYKSDAYIEIFNSIREIYKKQIS